MVVSMSIPKQQILVAGPCVFSGASVTPRASHSCSRMDSAFAQSSVAGGPMIMKSSR